MSGVRGLGAVDNRRTCLLALLAYGGNRDMSLEEIKARLAAGTNNLRNQDDLRARRKCQHHAPADIARLVDVVEQIKQKVSDQIINKDLNRPTNMAGSRPRIITLDKPNAVGYSEEDMTHRQKSYLKNSSPKRSPGSWSKTDVSAGALLWAE
jgi:hypothetical protein